MHATLAHRQQQALQLRCSPVNHLARADDRSGTAASRSSFRSGSRPGHLPDEDPS
jgi:hypothetical protein